MADITIAGVMRAGAYSPNHIGNDTAIFNLVAEQLRKRGCQVNVYSEEQFNKQEIEEPVVLAMCRERASIAKLQKPAGQRYSLSREPDCQHQREHQGAAEEGRLQVVLDQAR